MPETKQPFNIPDMGTFYRAGHRYYMTPSGKHYPSVTSVLKADVEKQEALEKWRQDIGDREADRIVRITGTRGTALHEAIERYLNGDDNPAGGCFPDVQAMFSAIKPVLDKDITDIIGQEIPMYSDYLETAGRGDLVAKYKGKNAFIDFKNSLRVRKKEFLKSYFMQISAYCVMFEERTGIPINDMIIIMAVEHHHEAFVYHDYRDNHIQDFINLRKRYEKENASNYVSRFAA
tara:strand:- start:895 stop:1593 length:699 start_codon:yes stop_codon:yes gene_type:complete